MLLLTVLRAESESFSLEFGYQMLLDSLLEMTPYTEVGNEWEIYINYNNRWIWLKLPSPRPLPRSAVRPQVVKKKTHFCVNIILGLGDAGGRESRGGGGCKGGGGVRILCFSRV